MGGDRATVYYYFTSRQEIFLGLVAQAVRENVTTTEETAAADAPAVTRLCRGW